MALYYMEKEELHDYETDWSQEEETKQDSYAYEADYGESSWREETCYDSDFGEEPGREEPEPKPPDSPQTRPSYPKQWTSWNPSPSRANFPSYHAAPKRETFKSKYETNDDKYFEFSGHRGAYLLWESNMDAHFRVYGVPKEERLDFCLAHLVGGAKRWWIQEKEDRWQYREQNIGMWGQLKWIMRKRYTPHSLPKQSPATYPQKGANGGNTTPNHVPQTNVLQTDQGKCSIPLEQPKLTCYRCKKQGHIAKECPTKRSLSKSEPILSRDPKENLSKPLDHIKVNSENPCDRALQILDKLIHMREQELLKAKEKQVSLKQEIVSNPKIEKVQTETCHSVFNASMTEITHLSSAQKVENVSGVKEDLTYQEVAYKKTMVFSDQNQNHVEPTPKLEEDNTKDDDSVNDTIHNKEEPPDTQPIDQIRGKLLNPFTLQWINLPYLCAGKQVLRTKPLEEGEDDVRFNTTTTPELTKTSSGMEHNGESLTTELTKYLEGLGFDIHQQNDYFGDIGGAIFEDPRAESKIVHTSLPGDHQLQNHRVNEDFSRARMKIYQEITYFMENDRGKSPHDRPSSRDGPWSLPASHLSPNYKLSLNGSLENHVWRPGDILNQLEALQYIPNSAKTHSISWIQCKLYFPEMEPNANNSQRLFPFQHVHVLKTFPSIQSVPRIHHYLPKLSRIKAHQDFPKLAKITQLIPTAIFLFILQILFLLLIL